MGASLRNLEGVSSTRDSERWLKRALKMERLSIRELCEETLEGEFLCCGP
jgi:hypothetical protein